MTIEEEIDVLDLYLQLEQMSFEESFSYKIILDEDLEAEEIVLSSMLATTLRRKCFVARINA